MNRCNRRHLVRTCWIALVAMLSLVLLPVMSEALAASAPQTDAALGAGHPGALGAEPGDGFKDGAFADGAFGAVDGDAAPPCLICAVPAALPVAPSAQVPTPGLREEPVQWPEGPPRAAWGAHTWHASLSRGPPPQRR